MSSISNHSTNQLVLDVNDLFVVRNLERNLLDELRIYYDRERTINDDLLESLHFVYKNPLFEALNQIDKHVHTTTDVVDLVVGQATKTTKSTSSSLVTVIKCDDSSSNGVVRPHLYQVKGSMDLNYYYLFEELTFCACSSFKFNVLGRGEYFYCKHLVMAKLLVAMRRVDERVVTDSEMSDLIRLIQ